ncbi:rRNA pseudouridine synthase [Sneathia sp. DSM 16631]|uniref:pseudouridine synthase n=1 Tax=Sneathia TaxID=168808 RepID=UPI00186941B1|nr:MULTISPECIES: pseudouridine synthase [Sneathia]MBE2989338.1 rRNA pseudouridine synthase [Sneathia sp. DSM 16630]MBE3031124.1 rRNA pseudouridine synthase [Sneathia sp. DSM 16631]MDK9581750.1 pseudouridine synthase [Sneathia vaginalis]
MRINKYIALSGFCSRRKADELIDIGRVTINKNVAKKGDEVRENDIVRIDGERVRVKLDQYEYYILNKPKRVICSNEDKFGRVTAVSLINSNKRLFTYGRLDYLTEGLIIVSNDGDLYNKIMHPRQKLYKSYIATIDKEITEDHIEALSHGVVIDGVKTAPAKVKVLTKTEVRIAIFEGRNRQIRKMFEVLGYFVKSLKRVKVGELTLKNLEVGKYRKLTKDEIEYLKKL